MFFVFLDFVLYEDGDESISLAPESPCPGDLTGDDLVGVSDALLILSEFGCQAGCLADLDEDGLVTVSDVLFLLGLYGPPCE